MHALLIDKPFGEGSYTFLPFPSISLKVAIVAFLKSFVAHPLTQVVLQVLCSSGKM